MVASWIRAVLAVVATGVAAASAPADVIERQGALVGSTFTHTVQPGDTWGSLGARFAVAPATLARQNLLALTVRLQPGQTITVDNRHVIPDMTGHPLLLNIAQRLLFFDEGERLHAYPVGVGRRDWPTPVGAFEVVDLEINPAWDVPASIQEEMRNQGKPVLTRVPPGPGNPLGSRFIRLSFFNVGIHGTSEPASIYRYVSHGCIRMHPGDVEALFPHVTLGMKGASVYEPVLMTVSAERVFLEVHPDTYKRATPALAKARALAETLGVSSLVHWSAAADAVRSQSGIAVDVTVP